MSIAALENAGFDVKTTNRAGAVLSHDFTVGFDSLTNILAATKMECGELLESGGNEAPPTGRLRETLNEAGWAKRSISATKAVDGVQKTSATHEIDHVRDCGQGTIALEIEWNNKDPFFGRDLENFQRLHADGASSVGMVITRGKSLQDATRIILTKCAKVNNLNSVSDFKRLGIKEPTANQQEKLQEADDSGFAEIAAATLCRKYGESTTHWNKLMERLTRGVGNPCPLLLVGLPLFCVRITKKRQPLSS